MCGLWSWKGTAPFHQQETATSHCNRVRATKYLSKIQIKKRSVSVKSVKSVNLGLPTILWGAATEGRQEVQALGSGASALDEIVPLQGRLCHSATRTHPELQEKFWLPQELIATRIFSNICLLGRMYMMFSRGRKRAPNVSLGECSPVVYPLEL